MGKEFLNKRILMLDLEGTTIDEWGSFVPINPFVIRRFIENGEFDRIGIFSFAIYDDKDLDKFVKKVKPHLEEFFEIKIDSRLIPTVDDIRRAVSSRRKTMKVALSERDFFDFYDKETAFCEWVRFGMKSCRFMEDELVLLDDMVEHTEHKFFNRDRVSTRVVTKNVEDI